MTNQTPEKALADELDAVLREVTATDAEHREAEAIRRRIANRLSVQEERARSLCMALFVLAGERDKTPGDANSANHARRMELEKETS